MYLKQKYEDKIPAHVIIRHTSPDNLKELFPDPYAEGGKAFIHDNGDGTYDLYSFDQVENLALDIDINKTFMSPSTKIELIKGDSLADLIGGYNDYEYILLAVGGQNIKEVDFGKYDLPNLQWNVKTSPYLFSNALPNLEKVKITNTSFKNHLGFSDMFKEKPNLKEIEIAGVDWSSFKGLPNFASSCPNLETVKITNCNLSSLEDFTEAFRTCPKLTSIDLSGSSFDSLTSIENLVVGCPSLTEVNLNGTSFENLTNMKIAFAGCSVLKSIDFSNSNIPQPVSLEGTFTWSGLKNCNFDGLKPSSFKKTFWRAGKDSLENFNFSANVDYSHLITMESMFEDCGSFNTNELSLLTEVTFDEGVNFPLLENTASMFRATELETIDLNAFSDSPITNVRTMFANSAFTSIDLSPMIAAKIKDFDWMFISAHGLEHVIFGGLDFAGAETMDKMFAYCDKLKCIDKIDTTSASSKSAMFYEIDDLQHPTASEVSDIQSSAGLDWTNPNSCPA